ncbi:MAG: hypothetical protein IPN34_20880 [Planctomycetes bacterium]|nr:hypothetical protein [Planctomycetota bacterium]
MSGCFAERVAALGMSGADIIALHGVPAHRGGSQHALIHCPGPGHEDRHPSCRVHLRTGRAKCFACEFYAGDVVALHTALGRFSRMGDALRDLEHRSGIAVPELKLGPAATQKSGTPADRQRGEFVAVRSWLYERANSAPAFEIVRMQQRLPDGTWRMQKSKPKPWKIYLPAHPGGRPRRMPKEFLAPGSRPLYRLPELLRVDSANTVYVVEGEPAADALIGIGLIATTASGGSSASDLTDWTPLAGRAVVIWPDRDAPGERYAHRIARQLECMDPPASVHIVDVDALGLPEGGDAVDWLARRGVEQ